MCYEYFSSFFCVGYENCHSYTYLVTGSTQGLASWMLEQGYFWITIMRHTHLN